MTFREICNYCSVPHDELAASEQQAKAEELLKQINYLAANGTGPGDVQALKALVRLRFPKYPTTLTIENIFFPSAEESMADEAPDTAPVPLPPAVATPQEELEELEIDEEPAEDPAGTPALPVAPPVPVTPEPPVDLDPLDTPS